MSGWRLLWISAAICSARLSSAAAQGPPPRDSIQVEIKRNRGLTVTLVDKPQYVVIGDAYRLAFRLHNRGNSAASIRLSANSALDRAPVVDADVVHLRPDEATTVGVRIDTHATGIERSDDVVQLSASEESALEDSGATVASARVMVVQPGEAGDPLATV